MTAPVLIQMDEGPRPFWKAGVFPMSFLLPAEHQDNPPKPTDDKVSWHDQVDSACNPANRTDFSWANILGRQVTIQTMPKMKVYVLSYGGWMTALNDRRRAKALSKALDDAGAKYTKGKHYAAGYNRSVKPH